MALVGFSCQMAGPLRIDVECGCCMFLVLGQWSEGTGDLVVGFFGGSSWKPQATSFQRSDQLVAGTATLNLVVDLLALPERRVGMFCSC